MQETPHLVVLGHEQQVRERQEMKQGEAFILNIRADPAGNEGPLEGSKWGKDMANVCRKCFQF